MPIQIDSMTFAYHAATLEEACGNAAGTLVEAAGKPEFQALIKKRAADRLIMMPKF